MAWCRHVLHDREAIMRRLKPIFVRMPESGAPSIRGAVMEFFSLDPVLVNHGDRPNHPIELDPENETGS
jgi:hypothetical protein